MSRLALILLCFTIITSAKVMNLQNDYGNDMYFIQDSETNKDYASSDGSEKEPLWVLRLNDEDWKLKRGTLEDEADYDFYAGPLIEDYKRTHAVVKKDSAIPSKPAILETATVKKPSKNMKTMKKKLSEKKKKLSDKTKLYAKEELYNKKEADEMEKVVDKKNVDEKRKADEMELVTKKDIFEYLNKFSLFYSKTEPDAYLSDSHEEDGPSIDLYFKGQFTSLIVTLGMSQWHYFISTRSKFPAWFYEDHTKEAWAGSVKVPEDVKTKFYPALMSFLHVILRYPL